MKAKVDIICNDGSPLGVTMRTLWGEDGKVGCGGAESALLTFCETLHNNDYDVTLYNNPRIPGGSPFEQRQIDSFDAKQNRDILIVFRSPNHRAWGAKGFKVWWSCDQYTNSDFTPFAKAVDHVVTISPFHRRYFLSTYNIDSTVIDIPIRVDDYSGNGIERVAKRCIFTSVPARGLHILREVWPAIYRDNPDASLVITSDYRLWQVPEPGNERFRAKWLGQKNVNFRGAVSRRELIGIQLAAEFHLYPNIYEELFCISVAESLVAGALPITSNVGALETTNMGVILEGNPEDQNWQRAYINLVNDYLHKPNLAEDRISLQHDAICRFHPDTILGQWEKKVFQ